MFTFITTVMEQLGAFGVGLVMLLENIFPPIPSEVVMPLAGFLVAQGQLSLVAVFVCGTAGAVLGAWLWYTLGRKVGQERLFRFIDNYGFWLTLSRVDMENAMAWFHRNDGAAVLLGRMVPGARTLISVPAGLADMPLGRFLIYSIIGSALWNVGLLSAGFLLEANYDAVVDYVDPVTNIILFIILAVYVVRVVRQLVKRLRAD